MASFQIAAIYKDHATLRGYEICRLEGQRYGRCDKTQQHLLLHAENRILRYLGDAEFQHGFGGNLDLLFR